MTFFSRFFANILSERYIRAEYILRKRNCGVGPTTAIPNFQWNRFLVGCGCTLYAIAVKLIGGLTWAQLDFSLPMALSLNINAAACAYFDGYTHHI